MDVKELPDGNTNYADDDIELLLKREDAKMICVLDVSVMYAAFKKALHLQMELLDVEDSEREQLESAITVRMMAHMVEFQRNNDLHYAERSAKMAANILREYSLPDVEVVVSSWLPILLWGTALFLRKRYGDISRVWELKAFIDGALWISPVTEEPESKELPNEDIAT